MEGSELSQREGAQDLQTQILRTNSHMLDKVKDAHEKRTS
jgi:hypothetical protein